MAPNYHVVTIEASASLEPAPSLADLLRKAGSCCVRAVPAFLGDRMHERLRPDDYLSPAVGIVSPGADKASRVAFDTRPDPFEG